MAIANDQVKNIGPLGDDTGYKRPSKSSQRFVPKVY